MKDLSLSMLSRGCGRLVSSNRSTGRQDGRVDVCFTPQDYYIWKSQESLLHLSKSSCLLVEAKQTLPKTYSTRRGPLVLYSQDLVTVGTNYVPKTENRKRRVANRYPRHVEQRINTIKKLTAAILNYSNNQYTSSRLAPPLFSPFHLPPVSGLHCPSSQPHLPKRAQISPELPGQLKPQELLTEENNEQVETQPEDTNWTEKQTNTLIKDNSEDPGGRNMIRLDLFLKIPCISRTTTQQTEPEPQPWMHYVALTPEEPGEPQQIYSDTSLQHTESSPQTETNHQNTGSELHHPNWNHAQNMENDQGCLIQRNSLTTSDKRTCEAEKQSYAADAGPQTNMTSGLVLPPLNVGHSVSFGPCWEKTDTLRLQNLDSGANHAQRLPPISESHTVAPVAPVNHVQTKRDAPRAERDGVQSRENLNRLHQLPLILPPLFPENEGERSGKQRGGREQTERRYFKKQTVLKGGGAGGRGKLPSEGGSMILLETGEDPPPPAGVLGCFEGWKGPGKQSSLAFLQNLQDPHESGDNRGVVRGLLPLELRDLQNGNHVGSLILGPDGEIIQLSLYDDSQNPCQGGDDIQQQALQVLSTEGEELPWVIVLQPDQAHTEGGVELNTDIHVENIQHHQTMCEITSQSHGSKQVFSVFQGLTDTKASSSSCHIDSVAVTQEKTKREEAVMETWKKPKREAKNSSRMSPLREFVEKEEQGGGETKAEEEEEEEIDMKRKTRQLSGSYQPGLKRISPPEATREEAVDRRRKRKDTEEAAVTTRKKDMKPVKTPESDAQKTSRTSKDGRRQRQKADVNSQQIRNQKQEAKINREAAETEDNVGLPPGKKKTRDREGERGDMKMNEEREEEGGEVMRQKEMSAGKRRKKKRGRLREKELVGEDEDPQEKEEAKINQEKKEESHLKSNRKGSASVKHNNNNTETNSEEDPEVDCLSTSDKQSSVQSVSSRRSSDALSQFDHRSSRKSIASSFEGAAPSNSSVTLASARGRLSSCSTVMITEEQLMLNPVKPESRPRKTRQEEEEEAAALRLAQRAERRRQEVERKRKEREEEERKQQEREEMEERMKSELEGERRRRTEELRLKKLAEEEERRKREEEEEERARREQAQKEMERRRQEEKKRQMERLQRMREEEEQRRKEEAERLRLEEEMRQEEENKKLQEMDENEREEYLRRKEQEEEERRKREEERKRREEEEALFAAEEARLKAELLNREMALLQRQLTFKRGLVLEAGGLETTQGISRPWIYSYFTLLELLGLNPAKTEMTS